MLSADMQPPLTGRGSKTVGGRAAARWQLLGGTGLGSSQVLLPLRDTQGGGFDWMNWELPAGSRGVPGKGAWAGPSAQRTGRALGLSPSREGRLLSEQTPSPVPPASGVQAVINQLA